MGSGRPCAYRQGMTSIILSDLAQRVGVVGLAVVLLVVGVGFAFAGERAEQPADAGPAVGGRPQPSGKLMARPGRIIVPGGHHHVITSISIRPARTAGSRSARRRVSAREPVA